MVDEIYDRMYREGQADLNSGLASFGRSLGESFKLLHQIQWSAPWLAKEKKVRCN